MSTTPQQPSSAGNGAAAPTALTFFNLVAVDIPEKLTFRDPHDWKRWISRWERYRIISGRHLRDDVAQFNTFLYTMGREAGDVLFALRLSDTEVKSYETVKGKFWSHFIPHRNIIFKRAKFNQRVQELNQSAEAFITDLQKLADSCYYGALRKDLIRDRIVVGQRDRKLGERMKLDSKLTLESAITAARTSESVRRQQDELGEKDEKDRHDGFEERGS